MVDLQTCHYYKCVLQNIHAKLYNYFTIFMKVQPQGEYKGSKVVFPSQQDYLEQSQGLSFST